MAGRPDHVRRRDLIRPLALRLLDKMRPLKKPVSIVVAGARVQVPVVHHIALRQLTHLESWMAYTLERLWALREGALVDVGVNVGQTLLIAKLARPDGEYVGFEPNPLSFFYASELARLNDFAECRLVPVGMSDRSHIETLRLQRPTDGGATLVRGFRDIDYAYEIGVVVGRGDDLLPEVVHGDIAIVKIDVEGGELEVLAGLQNTLTQHRPFIIAELLSASDADTDIARNRRRRRHELVELLGEHGYHAFRIAPETAGYTLVPDLESRDARHSTEGNYVLVPDCHAAEFMRADFVAQG